jgi:hypothetical protein
MQREIIIATENRMKNRELILLTATTILVAGYFGNTLNQDTIDGASDRLAKAVLTSDTAAIWSFVPDDEREFYGLDQEKFAKYWKTVVQPNLENLDSVKLRAAGTNGIEVVLQSSRDKVAKSGFVLLVSGQMGRYYVPYIVATSGLHSAEISINAGPVTKYQRFDGYAKWAQDNKSQFESLGIHKIRRGPMFPGETMDEMSKHFKKVADDDFERIQLLEFL